MSIKSVGFLLASLLASVVPAFCALPSNTVWEVRSTGADTNGGCYVAGSTGTDYSQQNSYQFNGTDLATTTTATVVSSASHLFVSTDVGNCIHVSAGTGWTVGFYRVVSISSNNATLDRAPAAASTPGGTWAMGGALANPGTAGSNATASNVVWVQTATYSIAASVTIPTGIGSSNTTAPNGRFQAYGSSRGDTGRATLQSTAASINVLTVSGGSWTIEQFDINCNSQTSDIGVLISNSADILRNNSVKNCLSGGVNITGGNPTIENSEITANGGYGVQMSSASANARIYSSWIHDNTATGIVMNGPGMVLLNVISNNTGATSDGIAMSSTFSQIAYNTIYGSGRNGVNRTSTTYGGEFIRGNLIANSGGYGMQVASNAGAPADYDWDGNAYWNNTSGNRHNADDTTTNAQNASGPYADSLDVVLTANPFTNAASNDFTLNNTAGGGAAARQTATPGSLLNLPTSGLMSFGALQPANVTNTIITNNCQTTGRAYVQ